MKKVLSLEWSPCHPRFKSWYSDVVVNQSALVYLKYDSQFFLGNIPNHHTGPPVKFDCWPCSEVWLVKSDMWCLATYVWPLDLSLGNPIRIWHSSLLSRESLMVFVLFSIDRVCVLCWRYFVIDMALDHHSLTTSISFELHIDKNKTEMHKFPVLLTKWANKSRIARVTGNSYTGISMYCIKTVIFSRLSVFLWGIYTDMVSEWYISKHDHQSSQAVPALRVPTRP